MYDLFHWIDSSIDCCIYSLINSLLVPAPHSNLFVAHYDAFNPLHILTIALISSIKISVFCFQHPYDKTAAEEFGSTEESFDS